MEGGGLPSQSVSWGLGGWVCVCLSVSGGCAPRPLFTPHAGFLHGNGLSSQRTTVACR